MDDDMELTPDQMVEYDDFKKYLYDYLKKNSVDSNIVLHVFNDLIIRFYILNKLSFKLYLQNFKEHWDTLEQEIKKKYDL